MDSSPAYQPSPIPPSAGASTPTQDDRHDHAHQSSSAEQVPAGGITPTAPWSDASKAEAAEAQRQHSANLPYGAVPAAEQIRKSLRAQTPASQKAATDSALAHNKRQITLLRSLFRSDQGTLRQGLKLLFERNRDFLPLLLPYLNAGTSAGPNFERMAQNGQWGELHKAIKAFLQGRIDQIKRMRIPHTSLPFQCTHIGASSTARPGTGAFYPYMVKSSPTTQLTTGRLQIVCPARQGPTRVDNIHYWTCLRNAFSDEQGQFRRTEGEREGMQAAFPEESFTQRDSSSYSERLGFLESLRNKFYQQNGPRFHRLREVFRATIQEAQVARQYPDIPRTNQTQPFEQFNAGIRKIAGPSGPGYTKEVLHDWASMVWNQITNIINRLTEARDANQIPMTYELYDQLVGEQSPQIQALVREASSAP